MDPAYCTASKIPVVVHGQSVMQPYVRWKSLQWWMFECSLFWKPPTVSQFIFMQECDLLIVYKIFMFVFDSNSLLVINLHLVPEFPSSCPLVLNPSPSYPGQHRTRHSSLIQDLPPGLNISSQPAEVCIHQCPLYFHTRVCESLLTNAPIACNSQAIMWRRVYLLLVLVRLYFALSPSYLHPDENFQGPEVIAGM